MTAEEMIKHLTSKMPDDQMRGEFRIYVNMAFEFMRNYALELTVEGGFPISDPVDLQCFLQECQEHLKC